MRPLVLTELLDSLGISRLAIAERSLPLHPEATALVLTETGVDGREHMLVAEAAAAWRSLKRVGARAGLDLRIVSAFRSIERQAELIRHKLDAGQAIDDVLRISAPPGYSEHHTGRAVDVGAPGRMSLEIDFDRSDEFAWLVRHGGEFGFTLSYPAGNPHGFQYEPWHWCYRA